MREIEGSKTLTLAVVNFVSYQKRDIAANELAVQELYASLQKNTRKYL